LDARETQLAFLGRVSLLCFRSRFARDRERRSRVRVFLPRRRTEKPRNERAAAASRFVKSARRGSCWRLSRKRFLSLLADLESLPLCTRESNDRRPFGGVIRAFVHQGAALATALLSLSSLPHGQRRELLWGGGPGCGLMNFSKLPG